MSPVGVCATMGVPGETHFAAVTRRRLARCVAAAGHRCGAARRGWRSPGARSRKQHYDIEAQADALAAVIRGQRHRDRAAMPCLRGDRSASVRGEELAISWCAAALRHALHARRRRRMSTTTTTTRRISRCRRFLRGRWTRSWPASAPRATGCSTSASARGPSSKRRAARAGRRRASKCRCPPSSRRGELGFDVVHGTA